jgi:hypothetical protein
VQRLGQALAAYDVARRRHRTWDDPENAGARGRRALAMGNEKERGEGRGRNSRPLQKKTNGPRLSNLAVLLESAIRLGRIVSMRLCRERRRGRGAN